MSATPAEIEQQMERLSVANEETYIWLHEAELDYARLRAELVNAEAKARLSLPDQKMTVDMRDALVRDQTSEIRLQEAVAEATVRAARAKAKAIENDINLVRSRGLLVRSAMEMS